MGTRFAGCLVVMVGLLSGGCTHILPAPPLPVEIAPPLSETPPLAEGHGRVVVDVADGPTRVLQVERQSGRYVATGVMCESPCFFDLPYGHYVFGFRSRGRSYRLETSEVEVGETPMVYRFALGRYDAAGPAVPLGIVATTLGGMAFITGAALLPIGLAKDLDGMTLAGGITLAAGGALTTFGVVTIVINPTVRQPGVWVRFPLP
ncbi:MAG: hypothetical protein P1V51_25240 [Deltaproteobacteria bacterium]|nr:hypothetical protein [Deltaproteobacteria bacterium]